VISGDYEGRRRKDRRTLAILAPTNKAASVLRQSGVPATTIHRILYTPVYDPEYEKIAEWLAGNGTRPEVEGLTDAALDRADAFTAPIPRSPARWRRRGCAGRISSPAGSGATSRSISGWSTRPRCSTTSNSRICKEIFPALVLFGDPAQLAPVGQSGEMVFDRLPEGASWRCTASTGRPRTTRSSTSPMRWDDPIRLRGFRAAVEEAARATTASWWPAASRRT
jgi:exodeoxyribonuclease-5